MPQGKVVPMMIKLLFADGTTWEDQNARRVRVNLQTGTMLIRGAHSDSGPDDVQVKRVDLGQLLSITVDRKDQV